MRKFPKGGHSQSQGSTPQPAFDSCHPTRTERTEGRISGLQQKGPDSRHRVTVSASWAELHLQRAQALPGPAEFQMMS